MFYYLDPCRSSDTQLNSEARKCLEVHVEDHNSRTFSCFYGCESPLKHHEMLAHGLPKLEITRACLSGEKEKHQWLRKLSISMCWSLVVCIPAFMLQQAWLINKLNLMASVFCSKIQSPEHFLHTNLCRQLLKKGAVAAAAPAGIW